MVCHELCELFLVLLALRAQSSVFFEEKVNMLA